MEEVAQDDEAEEEAHLGDANSSCGAVGNSAFSYYSR